MHVQVLFDRAVTIEDSVHVVTFTLELTLVLVVLVIFLNLSLRACRHRADMRYG